MSSCTIWAREQYELVNNMSSWTAWAREQYELVREQYELVNNMSSWTIWAREQYELVHNMSSWTIWAREQYELVHNMSSWTIWAREQYELVHNMSSWTIWHGANWVWFFMDKIHRYMYNIHINCEQKLSSCLRCINVHISYFNCGQRFSFSSPVDIDQAQTEWGQIIGSLI